MNLLKKLGGIRSHLITTSNLVFCTCMDASGKDSSPSKFHTLGALATCLMCASISRVRCMCVCVCVSFLIFILMSRHQLLVL